jgi:hypothetical protein
VIEGNATLMEQVFDDPQRKREAQDMHHRRADDPGTDLEIPNRAAFCHPAKRATALPASSWFSLTVPGKP